MQPISVGYEWCNELAPLPVSLVARMASGADIYSITYRRAPGDQPRALPDMCIGVYVSCLFPYVYGKDFQYLRLLNTLSVIRVPRLKLAV